MKTFEKANEAQAEADRLNQELIIKGRIAKVYLKFPEKRWQIVIKPFQYETTYKYLKEIYELSDIERKLTQFIPESVVLMAKHQQLLQSRDAIIPYQGSMADIGKLYANYKRREREIPYHNPSETRIVHSISYDCPPKSETDVGLCSTLFRDSDHWEHTWKMNRLKYDNGKLDGLVRMRGNGISDWNGGFPFENPNPENLKPSRTVGYLREIAFTDGTAIHPKGNVLLTNRAGNRLFIAENPIFIVRGWSDSQGAFSSPVIAQSATEAEKKLRTVYPDRQVDEVVRVKPNADHRMLYFFYNEQCSHCHNMKKFLHELPIKVVEIDCQKQSALADKHNILYTPTVKLFDGKKVTKTYEGEMSKSETLKFISE